MVDMEEKDLKVKTYQENIKTMKEYGTNVQTYFGTRKILKYAISEKKSIGAFFENETLNNCDIQFELNEDMIDKFLNNKTLGSLLQTTRENVHKPVRTKHRAAQIGKAVNNIKSINEIKVTLKTKFSVSSGKSYTTITACDVTPDGKLLFADFNHNKRILVHKTDGAYISDICVSPKLAFDVAVIDEENVVVSTYSHGFLRLNISNKNILQIYKTSSYCCGITNFIDGKAMLAMNDEGIISYGLQDKLLTTIRKALLGDHVYVTCYQQNIYHTNTIDNSVTCLNLKGEVIWTYIDTFLFRSPRSIVTDQHGNVFVSSKSQNSIVVISADGKHGRKIIDENDGIKNGWALCFDKLRNNLVVANLSGDVFVFDIE